MRHIHAGVIHCLSTVAPHSQHPLILLLFGPQLLFQLAFDIIIAVTSRRRLQPLGAPPVQAPHCSLIGIKSTEWQVWELLPDGSHGAGYWLLCIDDGDGVTRISVCVCVCGFLK